MIISHRVLDINLDKVYKLVFINGICQIDIYCQNTQKIFTYWL